MTFTVWPLSHYKSILTLLETPALSEEISQYTVYQFLSRIMLEMSIDIILKEFQGLHFRVHVCMRLESSFYKHQTLLNKCFEQVKEGDQN